MKRLALVLLLFPACGLMPAATEVADANEQLAVVEQEKSANDLRLARAQAVADRQQFELELAEAAKTFAVSEAEKAAAEDRAMAAQSALADSERDIQALLNDRGEILIAQGRAEGRAEMAEEQLSREVGEVTAGVALAGGAPAGAIAQGVGTLLAIGAGLYGRSRALVAAAT